MTVKDEIEKAITAHGEWKNKLRAAIETGMSESTPERVKQDNNCSFGKWLHERIDPAMKNTTFYNDVVKLHADFHKEAAAILEFTLKGDKDNASKEMELGKPFSLLSTALTRKMIDWQESL